MVLLLRMSGLIVVITELRDNPKCRNNVTTPPTGTARSVVPTLLLRTSLLGVLLLVVVVTE